MIVDVLGNSARYEGLHEGFKAAFEFLKKAHENFPELGRYEIDGDKVFALAQEYDTIPGDECKWEAHKKYIDIQFIHDGSEVICWDNIANLPAGEVFDEVKDRYLYKAPGTSPSVLNGGTFAIYWPEDIHRPKEMNGAPCHLKKVVVKVLV